MTAPSAGLKPSNTRAVAAIALLVAALFLERFGYYGMRSVLLGHLAAAQVSQDSARSVYGMFTYAVTYGVVPAALLAVVVPRTVLVPVGLFFCAVGIAVTAAAQPALIYAGLFVLAVGLWLYKAALFALVAELLPCPSDTTRIGAFALLYAAINLGALLAPLAVGFLNPETDFTPGILLAAAASGLAFLAATSASVTAPPAPTPRPAFRPRELVGALVLLACTAPALALQSLLSERHWLSMARAFERTPPTWFTWLNPLVVCGAALLTAGAMAVVLRARLRLLAFHLLAAGGLLFVLSAAPLLLAGGEPSVAAVSGSAVLAALAELVLVAGLLARLASASQPYFGALAVALYGGISVFLSSAASSLDRALEGSGALSGLVLLTLVAAGSVVALAPKLQALFYPYDDAEAGAPARPL